MLSSVEWYIGSDCSGRQVNEAADTSYKQNPRNHKLHNRS